MRLRPPGRAKLRTRVLLGVLAVVVIALAGFDLAAVSALRGYLIGQTDLRLHNVLLLYRAIPAQHRVAASRPGRFEPQAERKITGPAAVLPAALGQFQVTALNGRRPVLSVEGGQDLSPRLPPDLPAVASSGHAVTVLNRAGTGQVRLMAESLPGVGLVYATTSLAGVRHAIDHLKLILVIGSAAAGLAAAAGVAWVTRRGLRPIEVMAGEADKISAGDLTDRVSPHDSQTEVGRLAGALNGMLGRIQVHVAEREASQEATRRFFADASHELRTPLASLRANAELYQQGALPGRGQVDEAMRRITLEARRMGGLVDDMLRLARLDQQPDRQCGTVDLSSLAAECAGRALDGRADQAWRCEIADGVQVAGDAELLRRAIDNLLANVAAHAPERSEAALTVALRDGQAVVEVTDDGPGVLPDELPRIFDRFYRAAHASRRPGSGLGLAIVAAVADAHGGAARAELSQPHGLRVTLSLPALSRGGEDEPPEPAQVLTPAVP
jgi:two-component system OmpR family sensor kinase